MTYSDAWIEPGNDEAFATFLNQAPRFRILPPPPSPYWINHVRAWARKNGLPIEYPGDDCLRVRVPVSRQKLLEFLKEVLGDADYGVELRRMRQYIETSGRDDCTYAIAADEF